MDNTMKYLRNVKTLLEQAFVALYSLSHPLKKQILFESFSGKQYSDNPRAISEKFHELFPEYIIYWKLNKKENSYGLVPDYIKRIPEEKQRLFPFEFLKVLATSCCFVTNEALNVLLPKRKGQFFVCTWHGDRSFKKVAYDLEDFSGTLYEDKLADLCVAGSSLGEKMFKTAFRFSGEILKKGTPRDDVLVRNSFDEKERVFTRLGLSRDKKYLLYAPTFKDFNNHVAQFNNDLCLSRTIALLNNTTGNEWVVLSRAHSSACGGIQYIEEDKKCIIEVSDYPDMSDILLIVDALITDYSSSAGDAALRSIPIILFQSESFRRPLFKMEDSPFWVAHNQDELEQIISGITEEKVKKNCKDILDFYGTVETGLSSEFVAKRIHKEAIKSKAI